MNQKQIDEIINGDSFFKPKFPFSDLFKDKDKYVNIVNGRSTKIRTAIFSEFERCYSKWRYFQLERMGIKPSYYRMKKSDHKSVQTILTFLIENSICHYTYLNTVAEKAEKGLLSNQYYLFSYLQNENVLSSIALDIKKSKKNSSNKNSYGKAAITSSDAQNMEILSQRFPAIDTDAKALAIKNLAKSIKNGVPISANKDMMEMARFCIERGLV